MVFPLRRVVSEGDIFILVTKHFSCGEESKEHNVVNNSKYYYLQDVQSKQSVAYY